MLSNRIPLLIVLLLAGACASSGDGSADGGTESPDASIGPDASTGTTLQLYPPPPLAHPSKSFKVRVQGQPVYVEHHSGVSYARFAFEGPVTMEVEISGLITGLRLFPEEFITSSSRENNVLQIELAEPSTFVVWINEFEKLFVLADPLESPPDLNASDLINIADYGVDPSGITLNTGLIQDAIDDASAQPNGGTVYFPPGAYLAGTLSIKSDVTLYLAAGSLLQGAPDPKDYPIDPGFQESGSDTSLPADKRFLGKTMTHSRFLLMDKASNVKIRGRGTIDGEGSFLRKQHNAVPNLLRIRETNNVLLEDVLFRNSAAWSLHFIASSDIDVRNVKVINDRSNLNTDGIDPDSSSNVNIDRAFIYTKDDGVCVKATNNGNLEGDASSITVTNSVVSSLDAALKLGTESSATKFSDVLFDNNFVFESGRAMSVVVRDGALYENTVFRDVEVGPGVDHLIEHVIGVREPEAALGNIVDLLFEDIRAPEYTPPASNWTWFAQFRPNNPAPGSEVNVFEGADETHAVFGLTLRQFIVNGQHLSSAAKARDVANITIGPFVNDVSFE